ncbi:CBS-domain-containing membrane protein [Azospirillum agricola]|uniref:HPP family protein n=1 Tax=Azospirillum agricola TaxID=1720247 RepID=UPI001AE98453|nr:HPP family protein [Azospirillum agricola]MBP2233013.1 CBS-domain-containing membrane protein [Azospirillum agricola]
MKRVGIFLGKMKGSEKAPARPHYREVLWSWAGGSAGIGAISVLSVMAKLPLLIAPFGATCVLIFAATDSHLAQPRSVVGGYLVSALVGVLALALLGSAPWVVALSVGTAIAMMQVTRTLHAPAGAMPLLALTPGADATMLLPSALAGAAVLVGIGLLVNNLRSDRAYPRYWL